MAGSMNSLPPSGTPILISELTEKTQANAAVRITGRLQSLDFGASRATLADPEGGKTKLTLDTTLVEPVEVKVGSLCQVVGEMEVGMGGAGSALLLRARLLRCVDGLDMEKYARALQAQRAYLAARNNAS